MKNNRIGLSYLLVLLLFGILYVSTVAPTVLWQDGGLFQYRIWTGDVEGKLGLALAHPLYLWIGMAVKHIPWGGYAWRVNLISAVFGAFSVANLFLLLRVWLGRPEPAILGALSFGLAWTIWQHSCIAEVYTLYTALFLLELLLLFQYCKTRKIGFLFGLALVNGLALADHMLATIPLACYLVYLFVLLIKKELRLRQVGLLFLTWCLGALPYLFLIGRELIRSGDLPATLYSAAFGILWRNNVFNTGITAKLVKENILFIGYNYPTPTVLLALLGLFALYRLSPNRWFAHILIAIQVLFFVFAFRYTVGDRYAFFIPFYCLVSLLIGVGSSVVMAKWPGKGVLALMFAFSLLPAFVYAIVPGMLARHHFSIGIKRTIPYRDEYRFFLQPWRTGYRGPERFAREALASVEIDAIIYADNIPIYPLWYVHEVDGVRPDVTLASSVAFSDNLPDEEYAMRALVSRKPVYVVSPRPGSCPRILVEHFDFEAAGLLWKAVPKEGDGE